MGCYISSNDNRFYAVTETAFGQAIAPQPQNRFPAVRLRAQQRTDRVNRRDKTGGRSYVGTPAGMRKQTNVELTTYLTAWNPGSQEPGYGPLFRAALGGNGVLFNGGSVADVNGVIVRFQSAHGLGIGQALTVGGEIRFVVAVVDQDAVQINAPFSGMLAAGSPIAPTMSYSLASDLQSMTVFDYWSPATTVHRLMNGLTVERMKVSVNGDFHEFEFSGQSKDLIDSASFQPGEAALQEFPAEPTVGGFDYTIVPGHLGQVWIGSPAKRFYTLTEAEVMLTNNIEARDREFGIDGPACVSPGQRDVRVSFSIYEQDNEATKALYQAARQKSPISVMLQLGQQPGQMFGVYLNAVIPEVPEFDDREPRLQWRFSSCRAQGSNDDELYVAFG